MDIAKLIKKKNQSSILKTVASQEKYYKHLTELQIKRRMMLINTP
jgi:hypothetical protein